MQHRETCRSLLEDTSREHPGENQRCLNRETCRGASLITEFQVCLTQPFRKEDTNRKETVKRLSQQFENHPIWDLLLQDFNKTEEINPFSEESKDLITDMGNTEIFEFCETSSKKQFPDCAFFLEVRIVYCTCGKCMQPTERSRQMNKDRFDVLSIPGYVIKKNPTHGARHGPSVRQWMYFKAHEMLRKTRSNKNGNCKTVLETWYKDEQYRMSLSDIGWTEEQIKQYDAHLHWKIIPTCLHLKKEVDTRIPGKLS